MKRPNGYGSVVKLSGKRRRPYCADNQTDAVTLAIAPILPKFVGWSAVYDGVYAGRKFYERYQSITPLCRILKRMWITQCPSILAVTSGGYSP